MSGESLNERVALLRRASKAIRDEWAPVRGSSWSVVQQYHIAMADWLDGEALTLGGMEPFVDLFNAAYENESGVVGYLKFVRDENDQIQLQTDTSPAAVRLAQAYLGERPGGDDV